MDTKFSEGSVKQHFLVGWLLPWYTTGKNLSSPTPTPTPTPIPPTPTPSHPPPPPPSPQPPPPPPPPHINITLINSEFSDMCHGISNKVWMFLFLTTQICFQWSHFTTVSPHQLWIAHGTLNRRFGSLRFTVNDIARTRNAELGSFFFYQGWTETQQWGKTLYFTKNLLNHTCIRYETELM